LGFLEIGVFWDVAESGFCFWDDAAKFGMMPTFLAKLVWGVFVVECGLVSKDVVIAFELGGFVGVVRDYADRLVCWLVCVCWVCWIGFLVCFWSGAFLFLERVLFGLVSVFVLFVLMVLSVLVALCVSVLRQNL
jgi:hypothetical protein